MKIFRRTIGTIHDLGTPREWLTDALCWGMIIGAAIVFLICL